jgi:hypothetical protein
MLDTTTTGYGVPSPGMAGPVAAVRPVAERDFFTGFLYFAILIGVYRIGLDMAYSYIADVYDYQGLFFDNKTLRTEVMSWALLFLSMPAFYRVFQDNSMSGNILSILILFSAVPTISVMSFRADYELSYVALMTVYWALLLINWSIIGSIRFEQFRNFESTLFYKGVIAILVGSVLVYSYINTGLRLHFDLIDVYDLRLEARTFIAPFPLNYIVSVADNFLPFFAVYALWRRNWVLFAAMVLVIYINFSIAGTKQIMFVLICGVVGYFAMRDFNKTTRLIYAAIGLVAAGLLETFLRGTSTLTTLYAYRVLFIPAELHYSYYEYFQTHDILYFSQSILKWMSKGVEQENVQFLLGEYAIGDFTARANNGLFADAYSNLGAVGIFIYPVLIAAFLRLLDGAAEGIFKPILFSVVIFVAFVLLGMTLTSALITSGLTFLIFLLYSMPRHGYAGSAA